MRLLATAGHVDHGKSTLVRALTGMEPDRFREERERGLTIDLGFAWCALPSGERVAIIDVPGHVRFIKNLLAGVGAVEAALLVVSAVEGWMPQSEEHLRILEAVGVREAVAVVSNAGRVDPDQAELRRLEVGERLDRSALAGAPVVLVDSVAGSGLDALVAEVDALFGRLAAPVDTGRPRLWVDRSFTIRGAGAVVTGTLTGGSITAGDDVEVVAGDRGRRPSTAEWSRRTSVRAVHALGEQVARVGPGSRAALNLRHVAHHDLARGDAVVLPGGWHRCSRFDADLTVVGDHPEPVTRRGAHLAYIGSGEHAVRLEVIGARRIEPGTTGHVRVVLPTELPLVAGDRFVLRDAGRGLTVGGGEILDVDPVLPLSRAQPSRSVERTVRERGWVDVDELERLTGERRAPTVGRWACDPVALAAVRAQVVGAVAAAGPLGLAPAALDEREQAASAEAEELQVVDGRLRLAGSADGLADHPWLDALRAAPFDPPPPTGVPREVVVVLVQRGAVVRAEGTYFAAEAVDRATALVADELARNPQGIPIGVLRDLAGTSRRFAVALATALDERGITVRRGDVRVAGARLPAGSSPPGPV